MVVEPANWSRYRVSSSSTVAFVRGLRRSGAGHLARWRGHYLARLGDEQAIDDLSEALAVMGEGQYGRAEVSLRVDLAMAFRARGDSTESRLQAQRAADLAGRTGSERQRRRIAGLLSA